MLDLKNLAWIQILTSPSILENIFSEVRRKIFRFAFLAVSCSGSNNEIELTLAAVSGLKLPHYHINRHGSNLQGLTLVSTLTNDQIGEDEVRFWVFAPIVTK